MDDSFESNTAALTASGKFLLGEIADYITNQPGSKWRIEGYMDDRGSATELKKISLERANSVYNYLVSKGLSPDQFNVFGYGSSNPVTTNYTLEGRSTNRRVLIIRENSK